VEALLPRIAYLLVDTEHYEGSLEDSGIRESSTFLRQEHISVIYFLLGQII